MRRFTSLFVLAALAAPAAAQQGASPEGLQRAAARYGYADWPAPSAARAGIDPGAIEVPGYAREGLQVDPRRGRATLTFRVAQPLDAGDGPAGVLDVTLHATPAAARKGLLQRLTAVTGALSAEPNLGDVAFAGRDQLRVTYAAFVRGNVSVVARTPGKADALAFAQAADAAILAAATLAPGQPLPRPQLGGAWADDLSVGHPGTLRFERDPASPAPAWIAAASPDGQAGVLRAGDGWQVYASRAGVIKLTLFVCSAELQTAELEVELQVRKGE